MWPFDNVRPYATILNDKLNNTCPRCGKALSTNKSNRAPTIMCRTCGFTIDVTTRKNETIVLMGMLIAVAFIAGAILL